MQKCASDLDTDPAADCIQEIINSYPGFFAIEVYRIANAIASRTACLPQYLRNTHIAKLELTFTPVQPLMFRS
jgi:serine acetyltransferase